jgi:hypothetical protein
MLCLAEGTFQFHKKVIGDYVFNYFTKSWLQEAINSNPSKPRGKHIRRQA